MTVAFEVFLTLVAILHFRQLTTKRQVVFTRRDASGFTPFALYAPPLTPPKFAANPV